MAGSTSAVTGTGFGHGKVILLGEHAVVYGQPAIAAGMRAGITALARPGAGRLTVPAWDLETRAGDGSAAGTALGRLLDRLRTPALDFDVDAQIPPRAGLGSSAALAVAVARAAGAAPDEVMAAVAEAETVFHTAPSGIDAAAASRGGVGRFDRKSGWRAIASPAPLRLCVGLTGIARETRAQVEAVARLCQTTPAARRLVDALGEISEAGAAAIASGEQTALGRLFDLAHGLLGGLGVSTAVTEAMVHGARAAGALGAKLTGAGGGGAVIALVEGSGAAVLDRWRALGCAGFETEVGGG